MKSFEELFDQLTMTADLARTAPSQVTGSNTARLLDGGVHAIGKKLVEEAAESWMAAEHEDEQRAAEELAQLVYHVQVMMIARGISLEQLYRHL